MSAVLDFHFITYTIQIISHDCWCTGPADSWHAVEIHGKVASLRALNPKP